MGDSPSNSRRNAGQVLHHPADGVALIGKVLLLRWEGDDGLPLLVTPSGQDRYLLTQQVQNLHSRGGVVHCTGGERWGSSLYMGRGHEHVQLSIIFKFNGPTDQHIDLLTSIIPIPPYKGQETGIEYP